MIGGIDLGGTKIEARLFAPDMSEVARQRIATPVTSYEAMLDGLQSQIDWLSAQGDILCIGVGTPGLINPNTGVMLTANLPASGHRLEADLRARSSVPIHLINDCRAAILSEATDGAAAEERSVLGLTIGTGVAGGHVLDGSILPDLNGQHGEYGHLPLTASVVATHDLPLVNCGCGLTGCFETYLAGPGLRRLAQLKTDQDVEPEQVFAEEQHRSVREIWEDIATDLIALLTRSVDPDAIVLSGGLGMAYGLPDRLIAGLDGKMLDGTTPPKIVQAEHGDASGARGAALHARQLTGLVP